MHGNVMEWCADAWDGAERHLVSEVEDPMSASGNGRVLRGGSFSLVAYGCRSAIRNFAAATRRDANWGFRVVLGPPAVAGFGEVRPHMVEVPAGLFQMGSTQGSPEEQPVHTVHITRPFWIGKYEVTYTEWQALMGTNPPGFRGPNLPVVSVSWSDAMAYCAALTAQERAAGRLPFGYQYRLPTEAEWEYCCRAGTTTEWNVGSSLNCGQANFGGFGGCVGQTASVGGYAANTWGLHDTHGNVWEWCLDAWDGYPNYPSGAVSDPYISSGPDRVLRGGSWFGVALLCRSAQRGWSAPDSLSADFGFRVALAPVLVP
jgi:formylglycine-generating enzyme required for sulfatase activity